MVYIIHKRIEGVLKRKSKQRQKYHEFEGVIKIVNRRRTRKTMTKNKTDKRTSNDFKIITHKTKDGVT